MHDVSDITDAEVVARTLQNKDVFALLVERYEAKLLRYIKRLGVRNEDDAADVLQEIFIKIYKNLNGYDQSLSFSSWAYRIAHNEAISHFRKMRVRPEGNMAHDGHEIVEVVGSGDDLLEKLSSADDGRVLRDALETVDPKYRDIVILRYFEGKEYDEIADILEIPPGTVAVRLHRAKDVLKKKLITKLP